MNYYTNLRVKAINFWKKNKKKILIFLIIFIIVFIINNIITYNPHISVINDEKVPEKYVEPIVNLIDQYFNYCNNGEYENAYNLVTDECKKAYYPNLESFTAYVNHVFEGKKKIYNIQSYSIVDNTYVYSIRILDDILANGTTDGYYYYEEKLILTEQNGQMRLSIGGFISQDNPKISVEDDYMKVEIIDKVVDYETETYKIVVTNKSDDKYIVIADGTQSNEVRLNLGTRQDSPENMQTSFIVRPGSFDIQEITFQKYYDNDKTSQGIIFGAVRVLNDYNYADRTTQDNLDSAVKLYSLEIPL